MRHASSLLLFVFATTINVHAHVVIETLMVGQPGNADETRGHGYGGGDSPAGSAPALCPCNPDIAPCEGPDNFVDDLDYFALSDCAMDQADPCGRPLSICDVNCDGMVDLCDAYVVFWQFDGPPTGEGCEIPCGACCESPYFEMPCLRLQENVCTLEEGVYAGDGTVCSGDWLGSAACPIPAVTAWGLAAMALLVLAAGTVVLRRRPLAA